MLLLRLRWLWDIVKRVRYKPVDYAVDELEQLKRAYAIDGLYIYDDVFILNKKFASAVSDEIIRRKLNLVWGCQSTVHVIDREIAALAARAGCVQMDFGVESGSAEALVRMNKSWAKQEKTREAFRICREHGTRTLANWMFNTPQETEEDVEATLRFAKELGANTNVFGFFVPWPGGADAEPFESAGAIDLRDFEKFVRGMSWREHLETVDGKFRQTERGIGFVELYKQIVREFPVRSNFHLKLSPGWLGRFYHLVSWIHSPWFWRVLLSSQRKRQYLVWFRSKIRSLAPQLGIRFDEKVDLHLSSTPELPSSPGPTLRVE